MLSFVYVVLQHLPQYCPQIIFIGSTFQDAEHFVYSPRSTLYPPSHYSIHEMPLNMVIGLQQLSFPGNDAMQRSL